MFAADKAICLKDKTDNIDYKNSILIIIDYDKLTVSFPEQLINKLDKKYTYNTELYKQLNTKEKQLIKIIGTNK